MDVNIPSQMFAISDISRSLFEFASDSVLVFDLNGLILTVNPAACQQLGYSLDELRGQHISRFHVVEFFDKLSDGLGQAGAEEHAIFESACICRDGRRIPVEINSKIVLIGVDRYYLSIVRDITKRKHQEFLLLRSRRMVDAISRALASFVGEGDYTAAFDAMLFSLLDFSASECGFVAEVRYDQQGIPCLVVPVLSNLVRNGKGDDRPEKVCSCDDFEILADAVLNTGRAVIVNDPERDCRQFAGVHRRIHSFLGLPLYRGSDLVGMTGIFNREGGYDQGCLDEIEPLALACVGLIQSYREHELRVKAEALSSASNSRLNSAQRIAGIGSWELDIDTGGLFWSDEVFRIFQIDQTKFAASYQAFLNAVHPDDRDMVDKAYSHSLANRITYEISHRLLMADGTIKWVNECCETHYDDHGNPVRSLGTVQDITARKLMELDFQAVQNNLDRTLNAVPDLLSEMGLDGRSYAVWATRAELRSVPEYELIGKLVTDVLPANAASVYLAGLQEAYKRGYSSGRQFELTVGGVRKWFELSIGFKEGCEPEDARFIIISRNITMRKQLEMELREYQQLLRELAAQASSTREAERKHIARELHDELGQILSALRIDVSLLRIQFGACDPLLMSRIQDMLTLVDKGMQGVREVVSNLRPLALDMGIVPAISWLCKEFPIRTGTRCSLHVLEEPDGLDDATIVAIFRIVQESLTNVARHAEASCVEITLDECDGYFCLEIRDDGKGFDQTVKVAKKSFGLMGMRERALSVSGSVEVSSEPLHGTVVSLRIPESRNGRGE